MPGKEDLRRLFYAHMGARLSAIKHFRKLNDKDVEEACGLSSGTIRSIEGGNRPFDAPELTRLMAFFGISLNFFVEGAMPPLGPVLLRIIREAAGLPLAQQCEIFLEHFSGGAL